MLYSKIFSKTQKSSKTLDSINATYLIKAGFIDQTMSGVYTFLPLGQKVLMKIENIIREEMDTISSELFMPSLSPKALWEQTGRLETISVLMKAMGANKLSSSNNDSEYILNCTHEDVLTPIAQKFNSSYKDFPFSVYQIQTKFRNEARPKSGLLRCREFRMKDLYSFHTSEEDLKKYYETAKNVYIKIFQRLGLGDHTVIALASGGDFTEDYSHEFQTICDSGEDIIFSAKKAGITFNKEVAPSMASSHGTEDEKVKPLEEIEGKGIIGVDALAKFLKIPVEKTTKTLLFETEEDDVIVAAVRGDYDINEIKLKKIIGCKTIRLASEKTVKKNTKAEVGYAGIMNLPKQVKVYYDESMKRRKNFECGANKTNYHSINVNFGRDIEEPDKYYDIKIAKKGDRYPENGEEYEVYSACEVGNIFPLNTKFSKAFDYTFTDADGEKKIVYMGSYGIGSSRIMGVLVEKFHDEKGIVWPKNIAPFHAHLVGLDLRDESIAKKARSVYKELIEKGVEVLFDDRVDVTAGEKFSDADLIGIPFRIIVSKKTGDTIELKSRSEKKSSLIKISEAINIIKNQ